MARYTGPKSKISRKFNEPIFGDTKALAKKPFPPGAHGRGRRKKQSEYALQLMEKQKAKYLYGVLERQFSNLFERANRKSGVTGTILLQLLESRLDNVVYRMGVSTTRRGARQLVSHKHIEVNGKLVNIPSFSVSPGDVVTVREKSKGNSSIKDSISLTSGKGFSWIAWDSSAMSGTYLNDPTRDEIPENIQEQLIVELYSK